VIAAFKSEYALDASALLAVILNEPGHEQVRRVIDRAHIHALNAAEVFGKLVREGVPPNEAKDCFEELNLDVIAEFGLPDALLVGETLARTRRQGLSLGDCVCLASAARRGSIVVTADRRWKELHGSRIADCELKIQSIR
jgi:PIN domain nuclease of toxin-antitoxin system